MKRSRISFAAPWAALVLASGVVIAAETNPRSEKFDKYSSISEHNIFLKDRTIKPVKATQPTTPAVVRQPEESLVFRGAVLDPGGDGVRAYIEDVANGTMLRLGEGDAVARGRISDIGIDAIGYERNGEVVWIQMGSDLTGKLVYVVSEEGHAGATTGPVEIIDPNRTDLTMEEKLKLRRQQEKGR